MKKYALLLLLTGLFLTIVDGNKLFSQGLKLNKYRPGEGITWSNARGSSLSLQGYFQPMMEIKTQTDSFSNVIQSKRFRMRRLRVRMSGEMPQQKLSYRLQFDLSGTSETGDATSDFLLDALIKYDFTNRISLTFGQRSTYTDNRELFMSSNTLQLVERSRVTSVFSSIREFGLFLQIDHRTVGGKYFRNYLTLTNGDGANVFLKDHGGLKLGGRVDFLPFGYFTYFGQFRQADILHENSPKLVVGIASSYNWGMSSRRGRNSGAILYLDENGNESLPDYLKIGADFMFKYRGFSMLGEWVKSYGYIPEDITTRVRNDGSTSNTFSVDGVQDIPNYIKGRMMLGSGLNIQMGYVFKSLIAIDARYTRLWADQYSFMNNGTFYNRPLYYTLGISKYFGRNYGYKIQASITRAKLDEGSNASDGTTPLEGHEWYGRFITSIAF
jgi:hypothetical protein